MHDSFIRQHLDNTTVDLSYLGTDWAMGITTRTLAVYRQIIYGERQVGGEIIFRSSTGSQKSNYNMVILVSRS